MGTANYASRDMVYTVPVAESALMKTLLPSLCKAIENAINVNVLWMESMAMKGAHSVGAKTTLKLNQ
jgi:hypothetical protein